jgi:fluoride ion exporter CrcB/FEX
MQVEILVLFDHRRYGLGVGYGIASIAVGYFAIWLGTALVRRSRVLV